MAVHLPHDQSIHLVAYKRFATNFHANVAVPHLACLKLSAVLSWGNPARGSFSAWFEPNL